MLEDGSKILTLADFGNYSDGFGDHDPLAFIKITSLETAGALQYNSGSTFSPHWVDVTANQNISVSDISNNKLRYIPDADGNGAPYATIGFKVIDDHNETSSNAYTLTINVTPVNDVHTGGVSISGTATQGESLTAVSTLADVDGLGEISYQWYAGSDAIVGATESTIVLGEAEVGKTISVKATYTDHGGTTEHATSSATAAVANVNDAPSGEVTISGTATQGETLSAANTIADVDGLGEISYQWQADGSDIEGATDSSLVLGEAEVGKVITVVASYTDGHGTAEHVDSAASEAVANVNDAPSGEVTISGTATQGETLTADNTIADADGLGEISYQWQADGSDIEGATGGSLVLGEAEVGKAITVVASYTDGHGAAEHVDSAPSATVENTNDAPSGEVTISGTAAQGETLTAGNTIADVDGLGEISYQWQADGSDIEGATGSSLVLGEAEVGKAITVVASYTDGHGTVEHVDSSASAAVENTNDAPSGSVSVSGEAIEGVILSAVNTLADADGLGELHYQWYADNVVIAGAMESTFVLGEAQVGKHITVEASYTDGHGTAEQIMSDASAEVMHNHETTPPTVSSFSPENSGTGVDVGSDIVVTFSEEIQHGSGAIEIHAGSATGEVVASYDASSSSNLTFSGSTLTINPTSDLSPETHYFVTIAEGAVKDAVGNSFAGTTESYSFTTAIPMVHNGASVNPDIYSGPATAAGGEAIRFQFLGNSEGELLHGTEYNDFISVGAGDDAVNAGAGNDVIDGGLGSNFLTGGAGTDIFFLDGRGSGVTWSTITDWEAGEQLSVWGWTAGTSKVVLWQQDGAEGYKGLTMHADINGDGTIDTSVTFTGITSQSQLPVPAVSEGLLWFH
jgi:hypothetical protein